KPLLEYFDSLDQLSERLRKRTWFVERGCPSWSQRRSRDLHPPASLIVIIYQYICILNRRFQLTTGVDIAMSTQRVAFRYEQSSRLSSPSTQAPARVDVWRRRSSGAVARLHWLVVDALTTFSTGEPTFGSTPSRRMSAREPIH